MNRSPNLHVFYHHLAGLTDRPTPRSREITAEIQSAILYSGLYQAATTLTSVVVGEGDTTNLFLPRWKVLHGGSADRYEFPTLKALWLKAKSDPESYLFYGHSKASTRNDSLGVMWRRLLVHGTIGRWREAVQKLDEGYDSAGVFVTEKPHRHMSGNFYWVRASAVKDLPEPAEQDFMKGRFWAEFWAHSAGATAFDLNTDPTSDFGRLYRSEIYLEQTNTYPEYVQADFEPILKV